MKSDAVAAHLDRGIAGSKNALSCLERLRALPSRPAELYVGANK